MTIHLPGIGVGVVLRDLAEAVYLSRIESWDRREITVVKPVGVPAAYPYPLGTPLDVVWTSEAGQHVLPTELVATRSEGSVLLWVLAPVAQPWIDQRRAFVRVPAFGRVRLTVAADAEDTPADRLVTAAGYLIDVSEAAMQCSIWAEGGGSALAVADRVVAEFSAHGTGFTRDGVIQGVRPGAGDGELTVVVSFDQSAAQAKALRREVFRAQVDLRARWRRPSD